MNQRDQDRMRQQVRTSYNRVAEASDAGTGCGVAAGCCGIPEVPESLLSERLGYTAEETDSVPAGADLGLGCGNPVAIAGIRPHETVVDLGSGAGFDCFLAARRLGQTGKVIGVDMTPTMISKARANADKGGYPNVEFRLGEIEHLPVPDNTADLVISNCVINLSPDKAQVFREIFRVLRPGGRVSISDVVARVELPEEIKTDATLYSACVAGASTIANLQRDMVAAGLSDVRISPRDESNQFIKDWAPGRSVEDYVVSAVIEAVKPVTAPVDR
jgi:SAM-dependent methyltransferase